MCLMVSSVYLYAFLSVSTLKTLITEPKLICDCNTAPLEASVYSIVCTDLIYCTGAPSMCSQLELITGR